MENLSQLDWINDIDVEGGSDIKQASEEINTKTPGQKYEPPLRVARCFH